MCTSACRVFFGDSLFFKEKEPLFSWHILPSSTSFSSFLSYTHTHTYCFSFLLCDRWGKSHFCGPKWEGRQWPRPRTTWEIIEVVSSSSFLLFPPYYSLWKKSKNSERERRKKGPKRRRTLIKRYYKCPQGWRRRKRRRRRDILIFFFFFYALKLPSLFFWATNTEWHEKRSTQHESSFLGSILIHSVPVVVPFSLVLLHLGAKHTHTHTHTHRQKTGRRFWQQGENFESFLFKVSLILLVLVLVAHCTTPPLVLLPGSSEKRGPRKRPSQN